MYSCVEHQRHLHFVNILIQDRMQIPHRTILDFKSTLSFIANYVHSSCLSSPMCQKHKTKQKTQPAYEGRKEQNMFV